MPGFCTSRFLGNGKELDDLICSICLGVFRNPVVTQCCRQTYCEDCIEEWVTQHKTCPNDRKNLTKKELKPVPRVLINFIDNLKMKCDYESEGCTQVVRIGDLANHLRVCNFGPNQSSSLIRIGRGDDQEPILDDLNSSYKRWKVMLSMGFIIIMVILIGFCLFQFLYIKQNNEMIDSLRGDLAQSKRNHDSAIQSVKLLQNETIDSFRRDLAQSKHYHDSAIESVKLLQNKTIDSLRRELAHSISNQQRSIDKLKSDQERIEEKLNLANNEWKHKENEKGQLISNTNFALLPSIIVMVICLFVLFFLI